MPIQSALLQPTGLRRDVYNGGAMHVPFAFWVLFNLFVLAMLALDLGVLQRRPHVISVREAMVWTAFWIVLAAAFAVVIHFWLGPRPALDFVTGFLIEKSLSVDNLFVFLLIFRYFRVAREYQHKVLFWGVLGALVMRGAFIAVGVGLLRYFHWFIYIFGAIVLVSGLKLLRHENKEVHPEHNPVLKLVRRWLPMTHDYEGGKFLVRRDARTWGTPLLLVLVMVETTDIVFATDSIPAILAITTDPFIVYTSNVFAILGLRAIFFALAGMMDIFHYLHHGLSAVLIFIGIKMMISDYVHISTGIALGVVGAVLAFSILASLMFPPKKKLTLPEGS